MRAGLVETSQWADGCYDQCGRVHGHWLVIDGLVGLNRPPVHDTCHAVTPSASHQNRIVPAAQPLVLAHAVFVVALGGSRQVIVLRVERVLRLIVEHYHHVTADHRHAAEVKY